MNPADVLTVALQAAHTAGRYAGDRLGRTRITLKPGDEIVTEVDRQCQDLIADHVRRKFPRHGLIAEEACQLARYAGLSDRVSCFGICEYNPQFDVHSQTSQLAAQMIWHFIEAYLQRRSEIPVADHRDFKVFVVSHEDMEHTLTFHKSLVTGR